METAQSVRTPNRSTSRMSQILSSLGHAPHGLSVTELAKELSLSKSTVHRFMQSLLATELVVLDRETKKYHLSLKMVRYGLIAQERLPLVQDLMPLMYELRQVSGQSAGLHVRIGVDYTAVAQALLPQEPRAIFVLGTLRPLHGGAAGKVFLAFSPPSVLEDYIRYLRDRNSPYSADVDSEEMSALLNQTRQQGYAISSDSTPGWTGLAFPILSRSGSLIAVASVVGLTELWSPEEVRRCVAPCVQAIAAYANQLERLEALPLS